MQQEGLSLIGTESQKVRSHVLGGQGDPKDTQCEAKKVEPAPTIFPPQSYP